jgi:hypothetical protein
MDEYTERRRDVRIELREPLMASAEFSTGACIPAELKDVSESGAKFRFPECDAALDINPGCETNWTVCLPSGKLTRFKARVRWLHKHPAEYVLGVKFLDIIKKTLVQELVRSSYMPA